ncbi:unnamed protein product [Didymodactylos carnosus]|uniref:Putative sodium-coupled neutral amino acid transporter 11 n=1 Tax=Didymodactylos carnosus TaxID=1234261 RepID=A0A8S2MPF6_9BILA|nr:unnamed protein product [Didymodactylos carnosus]CAF3968503.1 unnamed protein product [Didymodactylos carnosus]
MKEDHDAIIPIRQSGIAGASYNLINSIVGSGVIGMSYAFRQAGFGVGIIILLLVAVLTDFSITLLLRSGDLAKVTTYQDLVLHVMGKPGLVSYNIIIGDTVTKISLVGLVLVFIVLLVLIKRGFNIVDHIPIKERHWNFADTNVAEGFGVMAFAFMCHHNSFLIYNSMEDATLPRWRLVTTITVFVSLAFAMSYGLAGYMVFGQSAEGDLLENYCHYDSLINMMRLMYAFNIMLTFPLECLVCRQVAEILIFKSLKFNFHNHHIIITIVIVICSVLISLSTDCLGIVLELNGTLMASSLAYILPSLCYIKLKSSDSWLRFDILAATIMLTIGISLTIAGFLLPLRQALTEGYKCKHGMDPDYCLKIFPKTHKNISLLVKTVIH